MTRRERIADREREQKPSIPEITEQRQLEDLKKQILAEMDQCPNSSVFNRLVERLEEINKRQATLSAEKKSAP